MPAETHDQRDSQSVISAKAPVFPPLELIVGKAPSQDVMSLPSDGFQKALGQLESIVTKVYQASGVPGIAVAVVHQGAVTYQFAGVRELNKDAKIDADTVFQIASISKSISAVVAARLMTILQENKTPVPWDALVGAYLVNYHPSNDYVWLNGTIGDYFAHRSGLPPAAGDDLEGLGFARDVIIERLGQMPLDPFRTSYNYCNFGLTIGAEAIAKPSGGKWEDLAYNTLFSPLAMQSTSYRYADFLKAENRAALHTYDGNKFEPSAFPRNADAQAPAGGVSSNIVDLSKFLSFVLASGRPDIEPRIDPKYFLAAASPQSVKARPTDTQSARSEFYGYGLNVNTGANGRISLSHSGAFFVGAATAFHALIDADVGIVVLTNGAPVGAAEAIVTEFMDIVQYGDTTRTDWYGFIRPFFMRYYEPSGDLVDAMAPINRGFPHDIDSYRGTYNNPYFGDVIVWNEADFLILQVGPRQLRFILTHWGGDTFQMDPGREFTAEGSRYSVKFAFSDRNDGRGETVASFTAAYFNDYGLGTFTFVPDGPPTA